jgi:hypothetical protein
LIPAQRPRKSCDTASPLQAATGGCGARRQIKHAFAAFSREMHRLECNFPAIREDVFMRRGADKWTGEVLIDRVVVWQIEVRTFVGDSYSFDINVPEDSSRSTESMGGRYFLQFPDCDAKNMPLADKSSLKEMLRKWIETEILLFDGRRNAR